MEFGLLLPTGQAQLQAGLGAGGLVGLAREAERLGLGSGWAGDSLASLDLVAEGRLVLGVGAGFPGFSEQEFGLAGVRFETRFSHLDDVVTPWRELWTGRPRSFRGKVLDYDGLPLIADVVSRLRS